MAKDSRLFASAQVTVTLELSYLGTWGPECTTEQIFNQAAEAAIGRVQRLIERSNDPSVRQGTRLMGQAKVVAVFAERETS